ncbi:hypothetical protein IVB16_27380 [Bradyrhizobium sp. 183]|uniref:hypothetical protein n=1 Tax=unclassified Bradyrhizobium TaxID=2631580 RepID=UPI001FFF3994|nr:MULTISPECIES: hypothetical protein [unclassified Bradyrhizobium]UPJ78573.1 hypothetical protein IVB17_27380 [Bradyrhizobium sp. 184]UPJ86368.1 hypothetical protein IVB16_27380 [Bradyrhizobium sp. 183]
MGEAKRRKLVEDQAGPVVYHHTSTLRTNLLWMSGVIEVEGKGLPPLHPRLGTIRTNALLRRSMTDFPPLAWFTSEITIPNCLRDTQIMFVDNDTGTTKYEDRPGPEMSDALALNRVAIGFRLFENPTIQRWRDHRGYTTSEGRELNETARDLGDDPGRWYVSEQPVDLLKSVQFWSSKSVINPHLERFDSYLKDMHNMVRLCKTRQAYIPPTWLSAEEAQLLSMRMGLPAVSGGAA